MSKGETKTERESFAALVSHELLVVLLSPGGDIVDHVFHLLSFLKYVSYLAVGVFGCYGVLITLTLNFQKSKVFIKAVKVVLELSKLAKQSYNTEEQLKLHNL